MCCNRTKIYQQKFLKLYFWLFFKSCPDVFHNTCIKIHGVDPFHKCLILNKNTKQINFTTQQVYSHTKLINYKFKPHLTIPRLLPRLSFDFTCKFSLACSIYLHSTRCLWFRVWLLIGYRSVNVVSMEPSTDWQSCFIKWQHFSDLNWDKQ